jgi:Cd2+/Zn2+-exporting ATPase
MTSSATRSRFRIGGMDCASCAAKIDTAMRRIPGIGEVTVSSTAGTMSIVHGDDLDLEAVEKRVVALGYTIEPIAAGRPAAPAAAHGHDHDHAGCGHDHDHEHGAEGHEHPRHDHGAAEPDRGDHDHGCGCGHDHAAPGHADTEVAPVPSPTPVALTVRGHGHDHAPTEGAWWRSAKGRTTIASGLALALAWGLGTLVPATAAWAFAAAMLIGLVPITRRAVAAAGAGTPFSIEMLMTVAALGALVIGAGEEGAAVVFLFLVGELLEGVAAGRARASITGLAALLPQTALVERGGATVEVAAAVLAVGEIVLVRPGDRIGADGEIVSGEGAVDEAPVTGESVPAHKRPGDAVFAGTVDTDGVLRIRVTATAADNTIARVIRQVEEAQESKAPTERIIDRFARWYTPAIVAVALAVAVLPPLVVGASWSDWLYRGLALLLIGCPCALVISTPAAIAASLSAGARRGLLLKGGAPLERLGTVSLAAFDKTGTLTTGRPIVTDVVAFVGEEADLLGLAASLEAGSNHPLAVAVLARAKADGVALRTLSEARAVPGKGVIGRVDGAPVFFGSAAAVAEEVAPSAAQAARIATLTGEGKTVSLVRVGGAIAGLIAVRDEPRPDAAAGLRALEALGVRSVMLTGDDRRTAAAIGAGLGIEVRAELMPADKLALVRGFQAEGLVVAKIGDGINDAPALAAADVGIAMGGGTDVALETADAAVLHARVGDVARMIELSRRTMGNIRQNIAIALGLKAVFLVTTVAGLTGLWPAILADTGATVLVTMNALRLLRARS